MYDEQHITSSFHEIYDVTVYKKMTVDDKYNLDFINQKIVKFSIIKNTIFNKGSIERYLSP